MGGTWEVVTGLVIGAVGVLLTWRALPSVKVKSRSKHAEKGLVLSVERERSGQASFDVALLAALTEEEVRAADEAGPEMYWYLRDVHSARDYGMSRDFLLLTSHADEPVTVLDIRAVLETRATGQWGDTLVTMPAAGAEARTLLGFDFTGNDRPECVDVVVDGGAAFGVSAYFDGHVKTVEPRSCAPLVIYSKSDGDSVTWRLRIDYQIGGYTRTLVYPESPAIALSVVGVPKASFRERWIGGVGNESGKGALTVDL